MLGSRAGAWNRGDATGPGALTGRSAAARPGLRLLAPAPIAAGRLRLLLIEDSRPYAALVEQMLVDALAGAVSVVHRGEVDGARRALVEGQLDCVLLDLSLPDAVGLEALQVVQLLAPELPVVVLTGSDDQRLAVQAVHEGAQDYLVKHGADGDLLARSIRYAIERKRAESRLTYHALHDALTGLPNRVLLLDRLNVALARARRSPVSLAMLFLDLDRFKTVNDSLGHDAGDELLVEVARRLQASVRPGDTVARFGGDEFLVLCEDLHGEREAVRVAERVRAAIARPMRLRSHALLLQASVGIGWATGAGATAQTLIREADAAMYRAKGQGGGIQLFEAAMYTEAVAHLAIEHQLPAAVERGELRLHYQPLLSLADGGRPVGVEALVRWQHPQRGLLMPAEFIALAEEIGLSVAIGEWVLGEACHQLAHWRREGLAADRFTVSVNVSPRQLSAPGFVDSVGRTLRASGLPAGCLCLEVTDTAIARDAVGAARALRELKLLGVLAALDDFGTGYSSLAALRGYPLDLVKIDRAFIADAARDPEGARFLGALLGVIHAAGRQAVAEGIESREQLRLLKRMGCDLGQGYLFCAPESADQLVQWLGRVEGSALEA